MVGTTISHYRVLEKVGQGSMGTVNLDSRPVKPHLVLYPNEVLRRKPKMKLGPQTAGAFLLTVTLATAASTTFVSIWKNPEAGPIDVTTVKMATFVVSSDDTLRWGPEETLAAELRRRGMDAVAGYTVLPGELTKDQKKAKEFLKKAGITGAIMMRIVGYEKETHQQTVTTTTYSQTYYSTFWGYWGQSWSTVYEIGSRKSPRRVAIETLIYSIEQDQLIWAAESETTDPKDVRAFAKQLVDAIGKEMRKAGLISQ